MLVDMRRRNASPESGIHPAAKTPEIERTEQLLAQVISGTTSTRPSNLQLLRLPQVISYTGLSKASIYADPQFPRPIKIGARASAWLACEIDAFIAERVRASRAESA